jgi:hypothetical protein
VLVGGQDGRHLGSVGIRRHLVLSGEVPQHGQAIHRIHVTSEDTGPDVLDLGIQGQHVLLNALLNGLERPDLLSRQTQLGLELQSKGHVLPQPGTYAVQP